MTRQSARHTAGAFPPGWLTFCEYLLWRTAPGAFYPTMWIKIEIVAVTPDQIDISITQLDDASLQPIFIDTLLQEVAKCWPLSPVKVEWSRAKPAAQPQPNGKRGGPMGTPKPQQLEIVKGWLALQGRMNQEVYAQSRGIGVSTLRRWMREFRVEGKL